MKTLSNKEIQTISGGLEPGQLAVITATIGQFAALAGFHGYFAHKGTEPTGFFIKHVVSPVLQLVFMGVGYEAGNQIFNPPKMAPTNTTIPATK